MSTGAAGNDVLDVLELRGRAHVRSLHERWARQRLAGDPAWEETVDAFAQARVYQALLVGHVDFARRPCRPQDDAAIQRGHVEFALAVLRLLAGLEWHPHRVD